MFISKSKKSPFYQLTYEVSGKRTTISTKTKKEKEAQAFLYSFQHSLLLQVQNNSPLVINHTFSLRVFQREYVEYSLPTKSKHYIESIELSFRQLFSFCGDLPLNKIESRIIDKFITSTFDRTQRGAHLFYRTLKAAFNKAVDWNYISVNPFIKVKFPKLTKSFPAFISADELLIILTNTPYQYLKDIFIVGFYTGLRLGELIYMQWNWVDFFQNQITVKCSDYFQTKSKKERIVPMSEKVRSILINRCNSFSHQPNEVVFYRIKGRKLHQETISKQFKQVVRISRLDEKIHFHSLRHSFASLLVQRGVSLFVVKELLGHEDLATTQIYSHLQVQNLKDAVNLLYPDNYIY